MLGYLATRHCARPDARSLNVLGSGVLARYTVLAIKELLPVLERVFVYSRDRERREAYAQEMAAATGWTFVPVDTPRARRSRMPISS